MLLSILLYGCETWTYTSRDGANQRRADPEIMTALQSTDFDQRSASMSAAISNHSSTVSPQGRPSYSHSTNLYCKTPSYMKHLENTQLTITVSNGPIISCYDNIQINNSFLTSLSINQKNKIAK